MAWHSIASGVHRCCELGRLNASDEVILLVWVTLCGMTNFICLTRRLEESFERKLGVGTSV